MIFKRVHIENSEEESDIKVVDGVIQQIRGNIDSTDGEQIVDCAGGLALPPLVESHIHLDTAMTVGDPGYNRSGTLFEGIALWSERKKKLTYEDVQERALQAIKLEAANGVQVIRTHVDICDPELTALFALLDLKKKVESFADLQIIAFPQEGILSYRGGVDLVKRAIDAGADGIGAIPHYEFTREQAVDSINLIMKLAWEKGIFVDVHCDETDDDSSRGLETLAARTAEMQYGNMVTASHTTAMHSYSEAYVGRLMRVLQKANLNFVSNPLVNINLQGRYDSYPKRRGLTRIPELVHAGLNVSFGQDDIRDPWYPMGSGNPVDAVFMGLHCAQMTGFDDIMSSYQFVTHNGAKSLGIQNYGIREGGKADFVVYDVPDFYNVIMYRKSIRYSVKNGKVIFERLPSVVRMNI